MKKRVAVISAVLDEPGKVQFDFNNIVSDYKDIVRGRIGVPFHENGISVISIIVVGTLDEINSLTGKLGNLNSCVVKTSVSKKEVD